MKHKFGKLNKGVDARRHLLLIQLNACVHEFEHLKSLLMKIKILGSCSRNSKGILRESF